MARTFYLAGLLAFASVFSASSSAQTAPAPGTSDPQSTSGFGKSANWGQVLGHQHGTLAFGGKVIVQGGALPWDPVPVIVVCDGKPRYNTLTDLKGTFRIEATAVESEVSPGNPNVKRVIAAQLIGCNVRAALEGFRSSMLTIANRSIMDDSDIGTISLRADEAAKGSVLSSTTSAAPKEAMKAFDKARAEFMDQHFDNAQRNLEKAVHVYPRFAEAWYELGKILETTKPEAAWDAFSKAAAADPQFSPTYEHLAAMAAQQKKWQDVVEATDHALQLSPAGTPQIWYFNAVGNLNIGHKELAEKSAITSLAMDPSHVAPNTEQLLAVMLAGRGDYSGALNHLRSCLSYTPPGPNADLMQQQVAQLEKIVSKAAK